MAPLRAAGAPYLDTLAVVPATTLAEISGDPRNPMAGIGRAVLLEELTAEGLDVYVELAGPDADTPLISLKIRHLGGALRSAGPDPGAAGRLDVEALVCAQGTPVTPQVGSAIRSTLNTMSERFAPWVGVRRTLLTFDEEGPGRRSSFTSAIADRLDEVDAAYDPDGLFVANHIVD